jgi:hypothetical protein
MRTYSPQQTQEGAIEGHPANSITFYRSLHFIKSFQYKSFVAAQTENLLLNHRQQNGNQRRPEGPGRDPQGAARI